MAMEMLMKRTPRSSPHHHLLLSLRCIILPPARHSSHLQWHNTAPHADADSQQGESSSGKRLQELQQYEDAARHNRLDLMTAAKILFSTPERPKQFGWDFHLWQFFVACLPPLAVYLCAQLIRSDIRQMEKEKEQAKEEREKANLSTEQKLYSSNVQDKDSRMAGRNENLSELPEVLLAFKARLDAVEEKIRLVEIASGESSKALKKEEVKDQIVRAAGNEGLPKSAHGEKKGGIPTNTQQGINSTSQENQTNFQVSSSINDDQKKIEQHTERVSNFWSFWRNKESRKYVEPPEKYQENPSHLPVNSNNMSQILTPQTGARGKTDDLALKKRNSFGANPDMSAVRSGKEDRPV